MKQFQEMYDVDFDLFRYEKNPLKLTGEGQGTWIEPALKFMFSRDPYTRLWSAYLDKFVLPDFWHTARNAIPVVRQNVTKSALKCGHDLTFEEFLRYNYDHRGAAETFDEDTNLVLASARTLGVIPHNPKESRLQREITDLVDYNHDIVLRTHLHGNISVDCEISHDEKLDDWKKQRTKSMRNAFRSLPKRIMKQFQEMYDVDFDLFQYEKYP
ncbi:hypothetical protein MAR_034669, partial [Mya arenaria]